MTPRSEIDDLPAEILDSYRVLRRIGAGGMGAVYEAVQLSLARPVALKVLRTRKEPLPRVADRFRSEIETLSRLRHPNIVPLYDAGWAGETLYLAMELVTGGTLHDKIRAGRSLGLPAALALMEQLLDGLAYLHANGVIHRDLKPENVLLDAQSTVKLADFGLAVALENPRQLTEAGRVVGTPAFMAPEQILKRSLGPPADLYAAGMILFRLLTGRFPFEAEDERELLIRRIEQEGLRDSYAELLPPQVREVVARCLRREPAERFQDAPTLAAAFRSPGAAETPSADLPALRRELDLAAARQPPAAWRPSPPRQQPQSAPPPDTASLPEAERQRVRTARAAGRLALAAAASALLATGGLAWLVTHGHAPPYELTGASVSAGVDSATLTWTDNRRYQPAILLDGAPLAPAAYGYANTPEGVHQVTLSGLEHGSAHELAVRFPDGSASPPLAFATRPLAPLTSVARREPKSGKVELTLPIPAAATGRLWRGGRVEAELVRPSSDRHRFALESLDPAADYRFEVALQSAAGAAHAGPWVLVSPLAQANGLARRIAAAAVEPLCLSLVQMRAKGLPAAATRARVDAQLGALDPGRRLPELAGALVAALGSDAFPIADRCRLLSGLEELRMLDSACEYLGLASRTRVDAVSTPDCAIVTQPRVPPTAAWLDVPLGNRNRFNTRELAAVRRYTDIRANIQEATYEAVIAPRTEPAPRYVDLALQAVDFRRGAVFVVDVEQQGRSLRLQFAWRPGFSTAPRVTMLVHSLPAWLLEPGPVRFRTRYLVLDPNFGLADCILLRMLLGMS
ncbi:MAG: serine/threonine protein kinase [Candidatus Wallbacteria bacterium]|nr:serine/threonine protein kinase [Candidatus Wallbacteria bacterium]